MIRIRNDYFICSSVLLLCCWASTATYAQTDYSGLVYHDGYWVTEVTPPGSPLSGQVINDTYFDAETNRLTVYAQSRIGNNVIAPVQVGPGKCTQLPNGSTGCFHPDAVYLNGSGIELTVDDGRGEWWVKHSWIVDGEGYVNHELGVAEEYSGVYVEGELLDDGISMKVGPPDGGIFNIRQPLLDEDPIGYRVTRFEEVDQMLVRGFDLRFHCLEEVSVFDGQRRTCPAAVPEPSSNALLISGMALMGFLRCRGKRRIVK